MNTKEHVEPRMLGAPLHTGLVDFEEGRVVVCTMLA